MTQARSYTFDYCRKTLISDNTTGYHGIDFSFQEGLSNFHKKNKKTKQNNTGAVFLFLLWLPITCRSTACTVNNKQNVSVNLDTAASFAEVKGERFANKKQWLSPCYCVLFNSQASHCGTTEEQLACCAMHLGINRLVYLKFICSSRKCEHLLRCGFIYFS